jgi:hypothetical protein
MKPTERPSEVLKAVAERLCLNLVLQTTFSESGNLIIIVHRKHEQGQTETLCSLVHRPDAAYPTQVFSLDYTQRWEIANSEDLRDFLTEYLTKIAPIS